MTNTAIFQVTQTERRIAFTLSLPRLGRRRTAQAAAPDWPAGPSAGGMRLSEPAPMQMRKERILCPSRQTPCEAIRTLLF